MKKIYWILFISIIMISTVPARSLTPSENVISLKVHNATLPAVLTLFEKSTDYTITRPHSITGTSVTAKIKDLPPLQALDEILKSQNYNYIQDKKHLIIYHKKDAQTQPFTFTIQHLRVQDISPLVTTLLRETETLAISEALNTLAVNARPETIKNIQKLIKQVDISPKQVLVRAKIIEIKEGLGDKDNKNVMGVDWLIKHHSNPQDRIVINTNQLRDAVAPIGIFAQVIGRDIETFFTAIEQRSGVELLASPWVTALNHHPSELLIGNKFGYKTSVTTQTGTQENIEFLEVGIKLRFTPHISEDGDIRMSLSPSISEGQIINNLPQEDTTETNSEVVVKDGQTIVIGGLTKSSDTEIKKGIPVLSQLPMIGSLFSRVEMVSEKRDIIIVITPTIITPQFLDSIKKDATLLEAKVNLSAKIK
ncbi:MAG: secretin N-terminal domain-containing protein [bacterium]